MQKKPYAKDVCERLLAIFCEIKEILKEDKIELYPALCRQIKYHFQDEYETARA